MSIQVTVDLISSEGLTHVIIIERKNSQKMECCQSGEFKIARTIVEPVHFHKGACDDFYDEWCENARARNLVRCFHNHFTRSR